MRDWLHCSAPSSRFPATSVDPSGGGIPSATAVNIGCAKSQCGGGGFPGSVLAPNERARREFFGDYVRTISQRDITEFSRLSQRIDFPRTLRLLAERTATIVNRTRLAERSE